MGVHSAGYSLKTPLFRVCSAQPREGNKRCVAVKKHLFLGINVPLWSAGRPCRRPARPQMLIISSQSKSRQRSLPGLKRKKRSHSNTVCPKTPRPTRKMPSLYLLFNAFQNGFPVFTSFSQRHFLIILRHELFYCCSYFAINYISF